MARTRERLTYINEDGYLEFNLPKKEVKIKKSFYLPKEIYEKLSEIKLFTGRKYNDCTDNIVEIFNDITNSTEENKLKKD